MSNPIFILPTRLSEPTHYMHDKFSQPIWTEFREDPKNWVENAKSSQYSHYSAYGSTYLTGGENSDCVAITTSDKKVVDEVVRLLLQDWPEVYVIDGPSYGVYSKLLMKAIGSNIDIDSWSNRKRDGDAFYTEYFHLSKFFNSDPDVLENKLEEAIRVPDMLNKLRNGYFSRFTLLSPFLPESLMLNFYGKISKKLELYYQLDELITSVNLVEEFSDECNQLSSLYMAGCLSCDWNHNCIPVLTDYQVEYGFRSSAKKVDRLVRKIADNTELCAAPRSAHKSSNSSAWRLLNASYSGGGGAIRSTEQLLLINYSAGPTKDALSCRIQEHLDYRVRKASSKDFQEKECSKCLLRRSCDELKINEANSYSVWDISKRCKGAVTKQDTGLETTLLEIATNIFLYNSSGWEKLASEFATKVYTEFSEVKLTGGVKKAIGILTSNAEYFYGAILLPTAMVEFMEHELLSEVCDSLMFDWSRNLNRGKFVVDGTCRIHTGVAGLEKFSNKEVSTWSILLPTHDYPYNKGPEREFKANSKTPWYIAISAKEFINTYGDLTSTRKGTSTSDWMEDRYYRVLYLIQAFTNISKPQGILNSGCFGVNKSLIPKANYDLYMPTNNHIKELVRSTNTVDLLIDYINDFVLYASLVAWPRAVVVEAFPMRKGV